MKNAYALAAAVVIATGSGAMSAPPALPARGAVMVHCPNGGNAAFVTPASLVIQLGDTIVWRTTGQTPSDSLWIIPKDSSRPWPFAGRMPAGRTFTSTGRATGRGTVQYAVQLLCRIDGASQPVMIDPEIIIQ